MVICVYAEEKTLAVKIEKSLWINGKNTHTQIKFTCWTVTRSYFLRANSNGTILLLRRNAGLYPANILKLYIHDVEAALNTLHQTKRYGRFTKNSHEFGLCNESLRRMSKPNSLHFCASRSVRWCIRSSTISISFCDNDRDMKSSRLLPRCVPFSS